MTLKRETEENFETFFRSWTAEASKNWIDIHNSEKMLLSYRRIAAFQGLKVDLLAPNYSSASMGFFHEAHNDTLVSHISASLGAWRLALQSLRSFIENSLCAIYFGDHAIEFRNWERGKFKIGFTELIKYFEAHPDLVDVAPTIDGLSYIREEYKTLSIAVHASAKNFRMTDDVSQVLLWNTAKQNLNKWSTRERQCVIGVALLLISLFRNELAGTQKPGLRTALSFVFGPKLRAKLKSEYKITIRDP